MLLYISLLPTLKKLISNLDCSCQSFLNKERLNSPTFGSVRLWQTFASFLLDQVCTRENRHKGITHSSLQSFKNVIVRSCLISPSVFQTVVTYAGCNFNVYQYHFCIELRTVLNFHETNQTLICVDLELRTRRTNQLNLTKKQFQPTKVNFFPER